MKSSPHTGAGNPTAPRLYCEFGGVRLYQGDYRALLPTLADASANTLISDPPYNSTCLAWDKTPIDWPFFWSEATRLTLPIAPVVLFSCGLFTARLVASNVAHFRYDLVWAKPSVVGFLDAKRRPLRSHETILVFARKFRGSTYNPQMVAGVPHGRGNSGTAQRARHYTASRTIAKSVSTEYYPRSVLHYALDRRPGGGSWHPTAKPLALMNWLVNTYSNPDGVILDPFAGSGTTLVAALKNKRRAVGIELNENYCAIAAARLRHAAEEMEMADGA